MEGRINSTTTAFASLPQLLALTHGDIVNHARGRKPPLASTGREAANRTLYVFD